MSQTRYRIEYDEDVFEDQIMKLPKAIRERVIKAIEEKLTIFPNDTGKPLRYKYKAHRRLRVGDYRVIYRVFDDLVVVLIIEVDHRKDAY